MLKLISLILRLQKVKILNHSILRLVTGKAIPGSVQRQYLISLEDDMVSKENIPPIQQCHWKCVQRIKVLSFTVLNKKIPLAKGSFKV